MDIILDMLGIIILWAVGIGLSMIGIAVFLAAYSSIKKINVKELNNYRFYTMCAMIIGAIFTLAVIL